MTAEEIKAAADKAAADKIIADKKAEDDKVEPFSDKQQKKLNDVIDARLGKVKGKHAEELSAKEQEIADLKAQLEEATKAIDKDDPEGKKRYKDLIDGEKSKTTKAEERAKANEAKAKSAEAKELNLRKEVAMSRAMQKAAKFVDTADVMALTQNNIVWNDELDRFVVLGPDKKIKQNSSLDPATLEEYFIEFAQKRPYLVNGDIVAGSGSHEAGGNVNLGTVHTKADLTRATPALTRKAKSDYIDKMGIEAFEALPLRA